VLSRLSISLRPSQHASFLSNYLAAWRAITTRETGTERWFVGNEGGTTGYAHTMHLRIGIQIAGAGETAPVAPGLRDSRGGMTKEGRRVYGQDRGLRLISRDFARLSCYSLADHWLILARSRRGESRTKKTN